MGDSNYSADSNYSELLYDVDGPVLTITLNRPDKLNAFTFTMMSELLDAFDRADADDDVRAIVVTGRGRAFCAGADLSAGATAFDLPDSAARALDELQREVEADQERDDVADPAARAFGERA